MKPIKLAKYVNTEVLYDQLAAAFPGWINQPEDQADYPFKFWLEGASAGESWVQTLQVPDDADEQQVQAVLAAHDPKAENKRERMKGQILLMAQSAVGVKLSDLSAAQIKALLACLLYRAGAIDPEAMQVLPLNNWLS